MSTFYKVIFWLLLISCPVYSDNGKNKNNSSESNEEISYPIYELSAGFGLIWLLQFNGTISPLKHFYFQPRFSIAVIANEFGFTVGYQTKYKKDSILRMGVGFSRGGVASLNVGGGTTDEWKSLYLRFGILKRWKEDFLINPNINMTRLGGRTILSGNVVFVFCIFKKRMIRLSKKGVP